jgi:hypothetical protein
MKVRTLAWDKWMGLKNWSAHALVVRTPSTVRREVCLSGWLRSQSQRKHGLLHPDPPKPPKSATSLWSEHRCQSICRVCTPLPSFILTSTVFLRLSPSILNSTFCSAVHVSSPAANRCIMVQVSHMYRQVSTWRCPVGLLGEMEVLCWAMASHKQNLVSPPRILK